MATNETTNCHISVLTIGILKILACYLFGILGPLIQRSSWHPPSSRTPSSNRLGRQQKQKKLDWQRTELSILRYRICNILILVSWCCCCYSDTALTELLKSPWGIIRIDNAIPLSPGLMKWGWSAPNRPPILEEMVVAPHFIGPYLLFVKKVKNHEWVTIVSILIRKNESEHIWHRASF